jgi:ceramide glucosyltransferase
MISALTFLAGAWALASSLWISLGLLGLAWSRWVPRWELDRARRGRAPLPAVSILKPLCGVDAGLEENLESFFLQDHADFELVFGVEDPQDPALEVVARLVRRYPGVPVACVVTQHERGLNPKVRNLLGMLPHARHDLVLVSDSNVRAPQHYVSELVACWSGADDAGLVTNVFAGQGEGSLGGALECVQLNGFCAAGTTFPTLMGEALVVGKSMLLSRSRLEQLGGLERVRDVLAEDFLLGKMHQHAGYRVVLAPTVLESHVGRLPLRSFLRRHLRWSMLRWRLNPLAACLEVVTSPLAALPLLVSVFGAPALLWCAAAWALRDVGGWLILRGPRRAWLPLVLAPLRDALILGTWAVAPLKRHVSWRGHRVRLAMGTLLMASRSRE